MSKLRLLSALVVILACGLAHAATSSKAPEFGGTDEPFASNAIYFVMTDRFVNGDPSNDQRGQGGTHHTFDIPVQGPNGESANIGYPGGDLQPGHWKAAFGDSSIDIANGGSLHASVGAHDVQIYLLDAAATLSDLVVELTRLMQERGHPAN